MDLQSLKLASRVIGVIALAILLYSGWNAFSSLGGVQVPEVPKVRSEYRFALNEQQGWPDGWKVGQAQWFHHASQGTRIMPRAWFCNLQQPSFDPAAPKIVEGDYLQRFGFLPSMRDPMLNPDGLPIGFAIDRHFDAPYANPPSSKAEVVGLTCAACHTSQILRRDPHGVLRSVRIEGGSAMINIAAFQEAIGLALGYTVKIPTRLDRFLQNVLQKEYNDPARRKHLSEQVKDYFEALRATKDYDEEHRLTGTPGGFARTDALGLIGNRVFRALGNENLIVTEAPVNFPPLWDTPWFDWVQYNGSIRMPLVRNIGEALGVGAQVDVLRDASKPFDSTVDVQNLHWMEDQLGGKTTLAGLKPPRWDDLVAAGILPALEPSLVANGAKLYRSYCQRCHLPPMDTIRAFIQNQPINEALRLELENLFETDAGGPQRRILKLHQVDLQEIGTDPNQALNFYRRVAVFRSGTVSAALGLFVITEFIRRDKFAQLKIPEKDNDPRNLEYNRYRAFAAATASEADVSKGAGMDGVLRANLKYRARPLDGLWATPPFLHNGSVPSLDQLLHPAAQRARKFYLGTTEYDSDVVGYLTKELPGGFLLDTSLPGNSNSGHEFRNLTLEELESVPEMLEPAAAALTPDPNRDEAARWARVLGYTRDQYIAFDNSRRQDEVRKATWRALKVKWVQEQHPFRGVLGAELTDDERGALKEYIKSL